MVYAANLLRIITSLFVFNLICQAQTNEWRGIRPLHSMREDVVKVLGVSSDANKIRSKYKLPDEDVYIVFASDDDAGPECEKQLKPGTVLAVNITPKKKLKLSDLGVDQAKLRSFMPSKPANIGFNGYIDDENGIIIRTFSDYIDEIFYIATAKDKKMCEAFYAKPENFIGLIVDFQSSNNQEDKPIQKKPKKKNLRRK